MQQYGKTVIVTLPFTENLKILSAANALQIELPGNNAISLGNCDDIDLLELRLDYDPTAIEQHLDGVLSAASRLGKKVILTCREPQEGGIIRVNAARKLTIYRQYAGHPGVLFDCELDFFSKYFPRIDHAKLILSKHFSECESNCHNHYGNEVLLREKFIETVASMQKTTCLVHKIVVPINSYAELAFYLHYHSSSDTPLIIQGTGLLGKLYRILRVISNRQGHYLSLPGHPFSASQLSIEESQLYRVRAGTLSCPGKDDENAPATRLNLGGLVGGEAVYNSPGLAFYNTVFRNRELNAYYLPFPVVGIDDFFAWLERLPDDWGVYGLSVTMPHKRSLAERFGAELPAINLLLPASKGEKNDSCGFRGSDCLFNTDADAYRQAFQDMKISINDRILICGYGGTAETALSILASYSQVCVTGRDENKGSLFAAKYEREFIDAEQCRKSLFDVLINCTSLGMKGEDVLGLTGRNFAKAIDLPVGKGETPLSKHCREKSIPCFDGMDFWHSQAKRQLELFESRIAANKEN